MHVVPIIRSRFGLLIVFIMFLYFDSAKPQTERAALAELCEVVNVGRFAGASGKLLLKAHQGDVIALPEVAGQVCVGAAELFGGSGVINGPITVYGTIAPGFYDAFGIVRVTKTLVMADGSTLAIALESSATAGGSYGTVRVGGVISFPEQGEVTIRLVGVPDHNIEGLDTFEVLSGRIVDVDLSRIRVENQTNWRGGWAVRLTANGLAVTASEVLLGDDGGTAAERLRILFIGDSITGSSIEAYTGYAHHVSSARPDWCVSIARVTTSESLLALLRENRDAYTQYDLIYINAGLHSLRMDRLENLTVFEENLSQVAELLKSLDTKVIWRTMTPIAEGASGRRDCKLVPVYNAIAMRVMREHGIAVDDMYAYLMRYYNEDNTAGGKYIVSDGTHWSSEAQKDIITPRVIEAIVSTL